MNVMADLCQFLCLFKAGLRTSLAVPTEQLWNKQLLSYSPYPHPKHGAPVPAENTEIPSMKKHGRQDNQL